MGNIISDKDLLELEKLKLEIQELRHKPHASLNYLSSIVPIVVSIATVILLSKSGAFESKEVQLNTNKAILELNISRLERREQLLQEQIGRYTSDSGRLAISIDSLTKVIVRKQEAIVINRNIAQKFYREIKIKQQKHLLLRMQLKMKSR